jgi:DDB1- and CUL4-associated factor 11
METNEQPPINQHHSDGDASLMTYSGHQVLQTLIRARFSPPHVTGQRYIYSGSYNGKVYSKKYGNMTKATQ